LPAGSNGRARVGERRFARFRAEPRDERVLPHADQHVAVQQEPDAAEHALLFDARVRQVFADAGREVFVVRHTRLRSHSQRRATGFIPVAFCAANHHEDKPRGSLL
jgi:hypothetical protein